MPFGNQLTIRMVEDLVSLRDVELVASGIVSLIAAWWFGLDGAAIRWQPLVIFVLVAGVSFIMVWWDIRTRRE